MEIDKSIENVEDYVEENEEEEEEEEVDYDPSKPFESKLGNKDYWDKFYVKEIKQFDNNSELIGEVWFGEQVQNKIVAHINEKFNDKNLKILDVGCGNAAFILKLAKLKYTNLFGMDYSEISIDLSKKILKDKLDDNTFNTIHLFQEDISQPNGTEKDFNIIHDKGTFDAFLSNKEHSVSTYIDYILKKSLNGTIFTLTSCNYSQPELTKMFLYENSNFELIDNVPHKSFNFGGSAGQVVTSLILKINLK